MGGGQIQLQAVGKENYVLTEAPTITYFRTVFRRMPDFSVEPVPQNFNVKPNFGERVSCTLSRVGDMVGRTYLVVELPAITVVDEQLRVRWIENLGYALIKNCELEIGGVVVDRHDGDWLHIWHELNRAGGNERAHDRMIGNTLELIGYDANKDKYVLYVPLAFFFCRHPSMALPLVSLEHSEVKIHIEFATLDSVLMFSPTHYVELNEYVVGFRNEEILRQGAAYGRFHSFDPNTRRLYYVPLYGDRAFSTGDITGESSGYTVTATTTQTVYLSKSHVFENVVLAALSKAYLLVDYVYLSSVDRERFYRTDLEMLIDYVQYDNDKLLTNNVNKIKLGYGNPVKELVVRAQLDSLVGGLCRDPFNYFAEHTRTRALVHSMRLLFNGVERETLTDARLFSMIQQYERHSSGSDRGVLVYSLALHPAMYQPSGTVNMSQLEDIVVEVMVDPSVNYVNSAKLRIYALTYTVLRVTAGVARLLF